jgi:hypothetical protein
MFKYKIPIETGRWQNIAGNDKICTICRETIRDEKHVITIGTIQKIKNTIYIGTLTIEDKTIYMRTRKT